MSLTKEDIKNLKNNYNLNQQQINDFTTILKEYSSKSKEDLLEIYRNCEYDIAKARQHLTVHTKFLVSYDLQPDGTVINYVETPVE